jgi:hypothetical protein
MYILYFPINEANHKANKLGMLGGFLNNKRKIT